MEVLHRQGNAGVNSKRASFTPSEAYRDCVPILKEKKGDLMDLRFISPVFHSFYREFPISSSSKGIHPDTAEDCLHNEGNMFRNCNMLICDYITKSKEVRSTVDKKTNTAVHYCEALSLSCNCACSMLCEHFPVVSLSVFEAAVID